MSPGLIIIHGSKTCLRFGGGTETHSEISDLAKVVQLVGGSGRI